IGLRDDYKISGPELEAMCDIARSVPGVLGERMLGGGDKGASGALVRTGKVVDLKTAIKAQYPQRYPELKDEFDIQVCKIVDGIKVFNGVLK
ncbi:MAG: galactokinase, partial [Planctomycetes bacterium]|nr:galactokinase [Planctomycetota bacterium]